MSFILRRPVKNLSSIVNVKYSSAANIEKADEIVIPKYIPRGETDILEALATTIKRDYTAPHYKFHDDPYLYPTSNYKKRVYALAQESGRKAAYWIRQEHKDVFMYRESDPPLRIVFPYENADPPIAAYIPRADYNQESNVTEDDLKTVIRNHFVADAITVYKLLESKNPTGISEESKQMFFEMMCYFNETEPLSEEWSEERWFLDSTKAGTGGKWKKNSLAMKIFKEMQNKSSEAYCAIIQGMCKYHNPEEAFKLYNESRQSGKILNTATFNALITIVPYLKQSFDLQWELIQNLLNDMNSLGLSPNVITLNNILYCLDLSESKQTKDLVLQVISEFVNECNIEPSLATWYYVMNIYYREKNSKYDVLYTIMKTIGGQSLKIQDHRDVMFFMSAMHKCRYNLFDLDLANKVHELLLHGSNYDLIGDSSKENSYYRFYFTLMLRMTNIESFIEFYNKYVPHVYVPEGTVMEEIIRLVDINGVCDFYPQLWSHAVMFGHYKRETLIQSLLESMVQNLPAEKLDDKADETTKMSVKTETKNTKDIHGINEKSVEENFGNIALDIWNRSKEQMDSARQIDLKAGMLSNIVMLLSRVRKMEEANEVVKHLSKNGGALGVPSNPDSLLYYSTVALESGYPSYSVVALNYLSECGFAEPEQQARILLQKMLNRPESDIEELIKSAIGTPLSDDDSEVVSKLLAVVKSGSVGKPKRSNEEQTNSTSSGSSSDTSDSDSDLEDDIDLSENK